MARSRKQPKSNKAETTDKQTDVSNDTPHSSKMGRKKLVPQNNLNRLHSKFLKYAVVGIVVLVSVASYVGFTYIVKQRVVTPLAYDKVIGEGAMSPSESPERFWGSYRPNVYFGMKTRSPESLVTGLMWCEQSTRDRSVNIRHTCEQGDQLASYGWLQHDGVNFGAQEIVDRKYKIRTDFVKRPGGDHGGDWTTRLTVEPRGDGRQSTVSLMFYTAVGNSGSIRPEYSANGKQLTAITGVSPDCGRFRLSFVPADGTVKEHNFLRTYLPDLHLVNDVVHKSLLLRNQASKTRGQQEYMFVLAGDVIEKSKSTLPGNFIVHQVTVSAPFSTYVVFESESFTTRPNRLVGKLFDETFTRFRDEFDKKFETIFQLRAKGFKRDDVEIAQAAMSNMIGGVGYFHGSSRVQSQYHSAPVSYWEASLYTAVPSRSHFPRGFLWDEGFHQLLVSKWDADIGKEVIGNWLDLMNSEGWIPREMILGPEALSKVPEQYVTQWNDNANPPSLFLSIKSLLSDGALDAGYLKSIYPRLQTWFGWFNTTQTGDLPTSYRWRGRNATTLDELNPKTLTSGLDDYPRASHPSRAERHVDLRCWVALSASVIAEIADRLGQDGSVYRQTAERLSDNSVLNRLHWCSGIQAYCDYGNHTDNVQLQRPPSAPNTPPRGKTRVTLGRPRPGYVETFGYVSLFPMLMQIVDPSSEHLGKLIDNIADPNQLWTAYGLRSLSKRDPLYNKHNTEHDAPYWRGPIWININYLAVRALHYYANTDGPHREKAGKTYSQLRQNVISNILAQYKSTGYIWENYNDTTGKGTGCYPFTGWSGLVVLLMGEIY